jgi:hypothetical protein
MINYRSFWIRNIEENPEDYNLILSIDPFAHWEQNSLPEGTAEDNFLYGLQLLYGQVEISKANIFFERSVKVVNRALEENKLNISYAKARFPFNRGKLLQVKGYSEALLGRMLDNILLLQACLDIERGSKTLHKGRWDDQAQADYLCAVRLALITGDFQKAHNLLQKRSNYNFHSEQYNLYKTIIQVKTQTNKLLDASLFMEFEKFFDVVRNPNYIPKVYLDRDLLRFELGIIREKILMNPNKEINWHNVIEAISA